MFFLVNNILDLLWLTPNYKRNFTTKEHQTKYYPLYKKTIWPNSKEGSLYAALFSFMANEDCLLRSFSFLHDSLAKRKKKGYPGEIFSVVFDEGKFWEFVLIFELVFRTMLP